MGMLMSMFAIYPLELILLSLLVYLLHNVLHKFRQAHKFSGHRPPEYPIIGCLVSFYKNRYRLLDWYTDLLSESATHTIVIRRLGARRTIVTANPENIEYMLKTNFKNFPKGKAFTEILGDFLGCGIFNVDGDLWHRQRKLASHDFSAKSLREYLVNTLEEVVENKLLPILDSIALDDEKDKVVDFQDLLKRLGFDIVCKVTLGVDPCCLDPSLSISPLAQAFDTAAEICAKRGAAPIFIIWKVKRMLGVGSEKRLKDAIEEIHTFVMEVIKNKKKKMDIEGETHGNNDLLSRMILAGHDDEVIRDMVISFIMAGKDTTSAAMTWLFYILSNYPDIEQELVKEVARLIKDDSLPQYEALKEMRFLKACLDETMRLYPPVAWDSKHAIVGDLLPDGTLVRAGDRVTYFPYGMGRLEGLWGDDWFEFKPNRWFSKAENEGSRGAPKEVNTYKFPVFQAGPRVCLGKDLAFIQMKYVVASILERFEIRRASTDRPVFVPLLTAHMAGGLKVRVRRRENQPDKISQPEEMLIKLMGQRF